MSGNIFEHIYSAVSEDFLTYPSKDEALLQMASYLDSFGPEGAPAAAATKAFHARLVELRAQQVAMQEELDKLIKPLQPVWLAATGRHMGNSNWNESSVKTALSNFASAEDSPSSSDAPDAPYVYTPPANLDQMSYDDLFVEDTISNAKIGALLNQQGLCHKTVCPVCGVDDFIHVSGCSKLQLIEDI